MAAKNLIQFLIRPNKSGIVQAPASPPPLVIEEERPDAPLLDDGSDAVGAPL